MSKRGSVLITALWAVGLFALMSSGIVFQAGQGVLLMKRQMEVLNTKVDFISGLSEVIRLIQADPHPHEDSPQKPWLGELELEGPLRDRLSIRVTDEESKLNLNTAPGTQLAAFFKLFEDEVAPLKGERRDYVKAILKLRFTKRIESLEELFLMESFEKEDFEPLKEYLTVYPERPFLNPNTADFLVIRSLIDALRGDHAAKRVLAGRLEEACAGERCFFHSHDLHPDNFMELLKLPRTPLMTQVVQEFVTSLTTDSETFRIQMTRPDGSRAKGVFRSREGQVRPEVFWWHED